MDGFLERKEEIVYWNFSLDTGDLLGDFLSGPPKTGNISCHDVHHIFLQRKWRFRVFFLGLLQLGWEGKRFFFVALSIVRLDRKIAVHNSFVLIFAAYDNITVPFSFTTTNPLLIPWIYVPLQHYNLIMAYLNDRIIFGRGYYVVPPIQAKKILPAKQSHLNTRLIPTPHNLLHYYRFARITPPLPSWWVMPNIAYAKSEILQKQLKST